MNPSKIAHLSWVKAPIEKAIAQCKLAMSTYTKQQEKIANAPASAEPIWFVNQKEVLTQASEQLMNKLGHIIGALGMIDSPGGYALIKEIQVLASYTLHTQNLEGQAKLLIAVQTALDIVPNYIGMVIEGAHDSPGVLLKHINELRALRGVSEMSDNSALPINLSFAYTSPPLYESDCDLAERDRIFNTAAASFAMLYSEAVRKSEEQPWLKMRELLRDLQRVTNDPELGCYWWAGEAIVDVIINDGLALPPVMNTALRVVMVATQRLPEGERAAKDKLNPSKFSALLNSLSISRKQTATSKAVITHFDVKENVEVEQVKMLQAQLESHSVHSLADILEEIKPRLETAMISFGRGLKAKRPEGFKAQMQIFDQAMRTIANVFGVFNEHQLSDVCFELADMAKGCESAQDFTPEAIEVVKSQIIFLDSRISHLDQNPAAEYLQVKDVGGNVVDVMAEETHRELVKVSRTIATHIGSGINPDKLRGALESLQELAEVYRFAGSKTIASILAAIVTSFTSRVNQGVLEASPELSLSARALVSLELYLQYIVSGLKPQAGILESGIKAVESMGLSVESAQMIDRNALLEKFDATIETAVDGDALMLEITELRPSIESMVGNFDINDAKALSHFGSACLRLGAASQVKGENGFAQLCRVTSDLAKLTPGRTDDPNFNSNDAKALINQAAEAIIRSMDDYSTKGTIKRFLVEQIEAIARFNGTERNDGEHGTGSADAALSTTPPETEVEELPEDYDPELIRLFREEFRDYASVLKSFLSSDDLSVTPAIARIVHSILGCASSAQCAPIVAVFDVLETHFFAHRDMASSLSDMQASTLLEMLGEIEDFEARFPWITESDLLPAWLEIAGTMAAPMPRPSQNATPREVPVTTEPAKEPQVVNHPVSDITAGSEPSEAIQVTKPVETDLRVEVSPPLVVQPTQQRPAAIPKDSHYDMEMADMYMLDADEVIPQMQENVAAWVQNIADKDLAASIRRNMHTLKGAAGIISAEGIINLTHNMETLFESISIGSIKADQPCIELVETIVDVLITMTDSIRNQEPYPVFPTLVEFVENCCDVLKVDGEELRGLLQGGSGATPRPEETPDDHPGEAVQSNAEIQPETGSPLLESEANGIAADDQAAPNEKHAEPKQDALEASDNRGSNASQIAAEAIAEPEQASSADKADEAAEAPAEAPVEVELVEEVNLPPSVGNQTAENHNAEGQPRKKTRRGYRGLRGRAHGERMKNWQQKQEQKSLHAKQQGVDEAALPGEASAPGAVAPVENLVSAPAASASMQADFVEPGAPSSQAIELLEKVQESSAGNTRYTKKKGPSEKLRVDLQLMDNAVSLANELKASSYRQNAIFKDMVSAVVALHEKLTAHAMHHNKMTLQLRHFNNQMPNFASSQLREKQGERDRLNLERFNHLSVSNTRAGEQIDQLIQDCEYIIEHSGLMDSAFKHQLDVTSSLQRDLLSSRLVSFRNERDSINAAVKNATTKTNKLVEVDVQNTDTMIDRQLLESLRDPIRHIINNSIAHGIEEPDERNKAGKPETGKITVSAKRQAKSIIITISDDGRGIDREAVRRKAISKGLISPDEVLTDEKTIYLITKSGFSTADKLNQLAGRGVGMEAASNKIQQLGGILSITSVVGQGTTMSMEMPLTIGSNRALVCSIADQWFAIPTFNMVQVLDYPQQNLLTMRAKGVRPVIQFDDKDFDYVHLADLIAVPDLKTSSTNASSHTKLVLVEQNDCRLAIEVEKSVSMPEIHVTKFDGILSGVKGIIGSTEIHDGTPALVLDVIELARLNLSMTPEGYAPMIYRIRRMRREVKPTVLVVDDAISYRHLLSKHFKSAGWEVTTAQDGQDAIEMLKSMPAPTLFVLDVEMPRMDGLALTEKLRAANATKNTPIIMMTTRTNVKEKALELGVNEFLSKPYQEQAFNDAIAKACPSTKPQGVSQ